MTTPLLYVCFLAAGLELTWGQHYRPTERINPSTDSHVMGGYSVPLYRNLNETPAHSDPRTAASRTPAQSTTDHSTPRTSVRSTPAHSTLRTTTQSTNTLSTPGHTSTVYRTNAADNQHRQHPQWTGQENPTYRTSSGEGTISRTHIDSSRTNNWYHGIHNESHAGQSKDSYTYSKNVHRYPVYADGFGSAESGSDGSPATSGSAEGSGYVSGSGSAESQGGTSGHGGSGSGSMEGSAQGSRGHSYEDHSGRPGRHHGHRHHSREHGSHERSRERDHGRRRHRPQHKSSSGSSSSSSD